jgi:hypothetical protein
MTTAAVEQPTTRPPGFIRSAFQQFWQALLLQERAYQPILQSDTPSRQGAKLLTVLFLTTGAAMSVGLVMHYLTAPKFDVIQPQIYIWLTQNRFYQSQFPEGSLWNMFIKFAYWVIWFFIRVWTGYPSKWDVILGPISNWMMGLFNWFTFAIFGELIARKLGGKAKKRAMFGTLAVAYAPQMLLYLNVIPGLTVPANLIIYWFIATSYQAVRTTYPQLSWKRSLVVTISMFALHYLFIFLSFVLGILLGVGISMMLKG